MEMLFGTTPQVWFNLHVGCMHHLREQCPACVQAMDRIKSLSLLKTMTFLVVFNDEPTIYLICTRIAIDKQSGVMACFDHDDPSRTIRVPLTTLKSITVVSRQDPIREIDNGSEDTSNTE